MLRAPSIRPGVGADFAIVKFGAVTLLEFLAQLPTAVQVGPGVGGLGPPVGSIEAWLTNVCPAAPAFVETTTPTVLVPLLAAIVPAKLQGTRPLALGHAQPVPLAESSVSPIGSESWICAVAATPGPELDTVRA